MFRHSLTASCPTTITSFLLKDRLGQSPGAFRPSSTPMFKAIINSIGIQERCFKGLQNTAMSTAMSMQSRLFALFISIL